MRITLTLLTLLGAVQAARAQGGAFPWKNGDPPPAIAGVHLGDSRTLLDSILGKPSATQALAGGSTGLTYSARGLSIVVSSRQTTAMIYFLRPDAGELDGIRLGATKAAVVTRWGDPPKGEDLTAYYTAETWAVIVGLDAKGETVAQLGIGLLAPPKP